MGCYVDLIQSTACDVIGCWVDVIQSTACDVIWCWVDVIQSIVVVRWALFSQQLAIGC